MENYLILEKAKPKFLKLSKEQLFEIISKIVEDYTEINNTWTNEETKAFVESLLKNKV